MNILITVATYYPRKDGVQQVTKYLAEGLVKKGHHVEIVTTNKNIDIPNEIINGVNISRVNIYTKYGLYFGNKKEYKKLIEEKVKNVDVMINVCTQHAFTDLLLNDLNKYNCKKVLYLHGIFDFRFHKIDFSSLTSTINKIWKEIRWYIYYKINKNNFKKYDLVTQLHEKDYGNIYFKNKYRINSTIIENAAENEFFENHTEADFKKPFDRYIINVANYNDRKNQKLAIKEFLKADIPQDVGLVLIGSSKNGYYDHLEKYIKFEKEKMNLKDNEKRILLLHDIDRKYISSYVNNSYLYIMTSKWEAYPISLTEAMAAGIPFISTDVGIVRYFFGGIIASKNDIHYWIEKLCLNSEIRNAMGKVGNIYAKQNLKIQDKIDLLENKLLEIVKGGYNG